MQTIIKEELNVLDTFTGEIRQITQHRVKKVATEPTDEFVKVSRYLNVIFAYNQIPLSLVPIALIFAQKMEYKTNKITLLIDDKVEIAEMLGCSITRVNALIQDCKKYDIIRPISRGKFEVNSFLFSTGSVAETRNLQAHFDFDDDIITASGQIENKINGSVVRKAVRNKQKKAISCQDRQAITDKIK